MNDIQFFNDLFKTAVRKYLSYSKQQK